MGSAILAAGHYLPGEVERVGVRRPIALDPIGPSVLAERAARPALASAGLGPGDVEMIIFATMTPDVTFPGSGCYFQDALGCGTVGALDIRAQCAGFLFALAIANCFLKARTYRRVLIAGAEVHSSGLDYSARGAAVARLFGDGGGVTVLGQVEDRKGIRSVVTRTSGRRHRDFRCEYPASRQHPVRVTADDVRLGRHFPVIDAAAVHQVAVEVIPGAIEEALHRGGVGRNRVDRWIVSNLYPDAAEAAAKRVGVPASRLDVPARRHGHLGAAALPVALSEALAAGEVGPGAIVCLAACGAGVSWGAAVIEL